MSAEPTKPSGSGRMLITLFKRYPARSMGVLAALIAASLLDGLGLSTILSMISLSTDTLSGSVEVANAEPSLPERIIGDLFGAFGLEFTLVNLLLFGIGLILFKTGFVLLANRQVGYAVAQVATDLRLDLLRAVTSSRWRYYLSKSVGSLSNAMATEAQRASEGYLQGAIMATQIITASVYAVVALLISWQVTLAALGLSLIVLFSLNLLVRIAGRAGRKQTGLLKSILTVMTDQLSAIKPLKAMAREEQMDALLSAQTKELNQSLRKQVFSKEAMKALQEGILVVLAAIGLFIMLERLGMELAAVMILIFLLARIVGLLSKAQRALQMTAISESSFWSLTEAIEEARAEREPRHGQLKPVLTQAIQFEQVAFSHSDKPVFSDASLTLPVGQLSVITGPSGAGKTTLIDLVAGLLRPDSGQILIDDTDLNQIDQFQWRRLIGYVPQEALLVNDSIFNNIALGSESITRNDVERALKQADALSFVSQMPNGLDTPVGERGGQLSGGQRQRLAIARALVHQPKLLILDEATSNLDQASEQAVLKTIEGLKNELTMLAVTHHQPLLDRADQVLRVEKGRIRQLDASAAQVDQ